MPVKGGIPWNKGKKNCFSEETRRKMSDSRQGDKHPFFGKHHSEETKRKMGIAHLGKRFSEETRKQMSATFKKRWNDPSFRERMLSTNPAFRGFMLGKHHSEVAKQKIRQATYKQFAIKHPAKGIHHSDEVRRRRSLNLKKRWTEPDFRERMIVAHTVLQKSGRAGFHISEEHKRKLREINLGKRASEETRRKMSELRKGKPKSAEFKRKVSDSTQGTKHWHWKGGKRLAQARSQNKRRALGYITLNESFEGSEGHHIDNEHVIFIPKELHWSIWHSLNRPKTMEKINTKVFCWILGFQSHELEKHRCLICGLEFESDGKVVCSRETCQEEWRYRLTKKGRQTLQNESVQTVFPTSEIKCEST